MNRIGGLTIERRDEGKYIVSFQLISIGGDDNVTLVMAPRLIDMEPFRSLPEPVVYDPEEWFGFGPGYPLRMRVEGKGHEARMEIKWNFPYCERGLSEEAALMKLPAILAEKEVLRGDFADLLFWQLSLRLTVG